MDLGSIRRLDTHIRDAVAASFERAMHSAFCKSYGALGMRKILTDPPKVLPSAMAGVVILLTATMGPEPLSDD